MQEMQVTVQSPRPMVSIYDYKTKDMKLYFDTSHRTALQSYSFKTAVGDAKGHFSLTFYPDTDDCSPIFDRIRELDIVNIYEKTGGTYAGGAYPAFTGVVRSKKYASQISGTSVTRRLVVSGHSVAGLISEFRMSMDLSAQVITDELTSQANVAKSLTASLLEKGDKDIPVKDIINIIWDEFIKLSSKYGKLSNPGIAEIISKWTDNAAFDIDEEMTFHYPVGCVFNAKNTQSFLDIINGIIPSPVYEKFVYMDRKTHKMRLKIRECPFDAKQWHELQYKDPKAEKPKLKDCLGIPMKLVKSFDVEQNDNEVYTVFFSYLSGYPVQMDKLIILTKQNQGSKSDPALVLDDEKYKKYGYRPLFVHFLGYGKIEGERDTKTIEKLHDLNKRLMNWYGNLELMYNGQIAMSTDLSIDMPQAGDKILFLGGQFYVTAAEHRWSYKGNPETVLTISRGGVYLYSDSSNMEFMEFKELEYWGRGKEAGEAQIAKR